MNRLSILEEMMENGAVVNRSPTMQVQENQEEEIRESLPPAQAKDVDLVVSQWGKIISSLNASTMIMLKSALVSAGPDNQIILGFYEDMQKSYFDQEAHRAALEKAVSEHIDKQVRITTRLLENRRSEEGLFINPNKIHLENVEFIDEDQF